MKHSRIITPCLSNLYLASTLVFIMLLGSVQSIYSDPPPYFTSFYCNLGTKTMADSGIFSCLSPKVIERADNFALALVEFNKVPGASMRFDAQITSWPGANIIRVQIRLSFKTAYTTRYGYMVLVIGYQPQNNWLDIVNVKLPFDQSENQISLPSQSIPYKDGYFASLFPSRLGNCDNLKLLMTSWDTETSSSADNSTHIAIGIYAVSGNSFTVSVRSFLSQIVRKLSYGVLVWKNSILPSNVELYKLESKMLLILSGGSSVSLNIRTNNEKFGPPFNTKCIIMVQNFLYAEDAIFELTNSTLGSYMEVKLSSTKSAFNFFHIICIARISTKVPGQLDYVDQLTNQIYYSGSQCPVPTTTFTPPINYCLNCPQTECINCDTSVRTQCIQCIAGYGLNSFNLCLLCSSLYSNCNLCTNQRSRCTSCMIGYGLTPSGSCASCSQPFSSCAPCTDQSTAPQCFNCEPGYFLNSTNLFCFRCQFPCIECSSTSTNCTKCPDAKFYYLNGPKFGSCKFCNQSLQFCLKCNYFGNICYKCNSTTTYLEAGKCKNCTAPCLECTSSTNCLSCVDQTTLLVNGTTPGTFICKDCTQLMTRCDTCLKPNVCMTCDTTGGPFYITYPPSIFELNSAACWTCDQTKPNCITCGTSIYPEQKISCIKCQDGHYLYNESCYQCPLGCSLCTDAVTCTSCITTGLYILQNTSCVLCLDVLSDCIECSSSSSCTKCKKDFVLSLGSKNFSNSGCNQCQSLQFHNKVDQTCDPCVSPCKTCLNAIDCETCVEFYEYVPAVKRCKDKCGDSVVITDECDNGLGVYNDGCSDQCKKEPNYTCKNDPVTLSGQSVSKSTCSYDLKVNISLFSVQKEAFKNTMTFTYRVGPYLFGLPGTTTKSFTQEELKQFFVLFDKTATTRRRLLAPSPTPGINVESVAVNPNNSQVSLTFSYDHNIRESDMQLYLDFQYLKSSLGLPYFDTTPDSDHVFQISSFQPLSTLGEFYTEEQYAQAVLLNKIATMIGIMSFLAFLIGIFTKEVAGLEMAMLCQFTYLSIFFFQGTLPLPFFALNGLSYSTGYNLPLADMNYQVLDQNPPQSFTLGFDPRTFWNNFNLMTALYILPLVAVIPFIPLKAKCVRKVSMIELGNKWVDLLLGEIMLFSVLFNFQYLVFGLIAFYRDGRDITNYASSTAISLGLLCTVCSFVGFLFKPEIYGNFRTAFRYDTELRKEAIEEREKNKECEEHLTKKFKEDSKCEALKALMQKFSIFVNENYFWRNYRRAHTLLTYNHYNFVLLYFSLMTLGLNLIRNSEIILMALSAILLIDLILMRPYCEVSEKLRGVFFAVIFIGVSLVRYACNKSMLTNDYFFFGKIILLVLSLALFWVFLTFIIKTYLSVSQKLIDQEKVIINVFKQTDDYDFQIAINEEQLILKNLMKRYERVELQYNVDNARKDLKLNYEKTNNKKLENKLTVSDDPLNQIIAHNYAQSNLENGYAEIFNKAEQEKFYKDLRVDLKKEYRRNKKRAEKAKVKGDEMLKLLKLNNFKKYQKFYLPNSTQNSSSFQKTHSSQDESFLNEQKLKEDLHSTQKDETIDESSMEMDEKIDYKSVEPQNLEEAEEKIAEERALVDENQYVRYKRAMQLISNEGLVVDKKLIAARYEYV